MVLLPEGRQPDRSEQLLGQLVQLLQGIQIQLDMLVRMESGETTRKAVALRIKEGDAKFAELMEGARAGLAEQDGEGVDV